MNDISQAAAAVWDEFIQLEQSDQTARKLLNKINSGKATYEDLQSFSNWMSTNLVQITAKNFPEDSQAVLDALKNTTVCRNYFNHIDEAIKSVQQGMNTDAGLGLKPVTIHHPDQLLDGTVSASDDFSADVQRFASALVDSSLKHVALTELANARFQSRAGCEVTVTRIYDHVGLHNGKQSCEWCLARVGKDVPYKEAVARGMFERHEGCHCTIIYHSEKGTTVQRRAGGRDSWESKAERNKRISWAESGDNIGSSIKTPRQREFEAIINSETPNSICPKLIKYHEALGDYTPESLKNMLDGSRFKTEALSRGDLKGKQYSDNGGYKAVIGDDGMISYHPAGGRHHKGEAYYKISSGKTGIKRYHLDGSEKND